MLAGLDAWRAGIGAGADPVRRRRIESLARRTADMPHGPARRLLEQKLATLMRSSPGQVAAAQGNATAKAATPAARGALAELAAMLASQAPTHALHERAPSGETELLRHMHKIWSRLSADRRLTQSLAKVPDKAGPLNSHHLVHRALAAMREASPGYFHHFVSQVDALLALDQMMQAINAPAPAPAAASAAPARQRKGSRTKAS
ncbi:MAG: DUF2894 domain-containing protein [Proteobacteria bacterium]|nr:DUF2894 domain-containing protein [Pseudomonadota bacterium]